MTGDNKDLLPVTSGYKDESFIEEVGEQVL